MGSETTLGISGESLLSEWTSSGGDGELRSSTTADGRRARAVDVARGAMGSVDVACDDEGSPEDIVFRYRERKRVERRRRENELV